VSAEEIDVRILLQGTVLAESVGHRRALDYWRLGQVPALCTCVGPTAICHLSVHLLLVCDCKVADGCASTCLHVTISQASAHYGSCLKPWDVCVLHIDHSHLVSRRGLCCRAGIEDG